MLCCVFFYLFALSTDSSHVAAFNEKLLLGNGLIVSPFKSQGPEGAGKPRSLRQAVAAIDNEKDINDYVAGQHGKIQPYSEVRYERNPVSFSIPTSHSLPCSVFTCLHSLRKRIVPF